MTKVYGKSLYMVVAILKRLPDRYEKVENGFDGVYNNLSEEELRKIERYL